MAGEYKLFDFTEEIIERFRENREIPCHFYNKDGQILIYKKEEASDREIDRLLRFVSQGVYYNTEDSDVLGLGDKEPKEEASEVTEDGLSDVKLLGEQHAEALTESANEVLNQAKLQTISSGLTQRTGEEMRKIFHDFESQPDAMSGLVNIIELMGGTNSGHDVEIAVKRVVVAMAMKTRGMKATNFRDQRKMEEIVNILMMSAMLCDIGYAKMTMPEGEHLSAKEYEYIKNHPIMSYLMVAHEPTIDARVKHNILMHHHPQREGTRGTNNYPTIKVLLTKLGALAEKYAEQPARQAVAQDMYKQMQLVKQDVPYHEDANILAVASAFASLTTDTPWRAAMTPARAIRQIVNDSFFTYTDRIVREFLDHVAMSLNENEKVIHEGDFIIVASRGTGQTHFEACQVTNIGRYQSKPGIDRIATVFPEPGRSPRTCFMAWQPDKMRPDPRYAHYELSSDDSRHLVYVVEEDEHPDLFKRLSELAANKPIREIKKKKQ